jgi:hypothetical protein
MGNLIAVLQHITFRPFAFQPGKIRNGKPFSFFAFKVEHKFPNYGFHLFPFL